MVEAVAMVTLRPFDQKLFALFGSFDLFVVFTVFALFNMARQ